MRVAPAARRGSAARLVAAACAVLSIPFSGATSVLAQTTEDLNSNSMSQIHADALTGLGITGRGVTVAVIDTGILASHPDLKGRVLKGYNSLASTNKTKDRNGHGTHVAGIIGAAHDGKGTMGVAPDVTLLPVEVLGADGWGTSQSVARGIQWVVDRKLSPKAKPEQKAFAINMSLGASVPSASIEAALRNAVSAGLFVAAAAGNSGDTGTGGNPIWPARYAREAWSNGQILAVGAVDANNEIAWFSNRAGDAMNFYLVAPGVEIRSTYSDYNRRTRTTKARYATMSGTSMATPHVTGAAALLKSGWSFLTAQEIAAILLDTAQDLGDPGVDPIYGHGLLDLEAALSPIGGLTTPAPGGSSLSLGGTSISSMSVSSRALELAGQSGLLSVSSYDHYGRDYSVNLAPFLQRSTSGNALAPLLAAADSADAFTYSRFGSTQRFALRSGASSLSLGGMPNPDGRLLAGSGFAFSSVDAGGRELVFGSSGMGAQAFGLAGELARRGDAALVPALANPYFALAPQHMHAGYGWQLRSGLWLRTGVLVAQPELVPEEFALALQQPHALRRTLTLAELGGDLPSGVWSLGVARLDERDSVLGTTQTGALRFEGGARTDIASFGLAFSPAPHLRVGAEYSAGRTAGSDNERSDSFVSSYGASRSQAYAAFASLHDVLRAGDQLSFTVSRPLRVTAGAMNWVVPSGVDAGGAPVIASRSISLVPDGRETRADFFYMRPLRPQASWFLGLSLRREPDHDATAHPDVALGAGLRASF